MTLTNMYGITTIHTRSSNPCRRAELQDYPVPLLLDYDSCVRYIQKYYPDDELWRPKVESERVCWMLVKMMVECHSGRRRVSDGNMIVVDESRPTYDYLLARSDSGAYTGQIWSDRSQERASLYRESIRKSLEPTHSRKLKPFPRMIRNVPDRGVLE